MVVLLGAGATHSGRVHGRDGAARRFSTSAGEISSPRSDTMSPVQRRDVVVLGSTGSIGTQALDLVRDNPDRFRVVGLTAGGSNPELFEKQVAEFAPAFSGLGEEASTEAAGRACDVVLNGITGAVGLRPTLAALEAGNTLALANKESLIIGGPLVTRLAAPGQIVPVDSEHSALAQCLRAGRADEVRRLVLTASGGPFRGWSAERLRDVTPEQALAHPTWAMGPVISVNSATLVNKGLEVIEAHLLVRARLRPHRGRRAPDQRRALDGGVRRRLHDRAGQPADDADPDRAGPGLARPGPRRRRARRLDPRRRPGSSSRSTTRPSPRSGSRGRPGRPAGPRRRRTTRPTRCAWTPSSGAG